MKRNIAIVGLALMLSACGVEIVDTGHRGIKTTFGEIVGEPLPEGLYFYNPATSDIREYDVRAVRIDSTTETYTKDVQQATIKYTLNVAPDPGALDALIRDVGPDYAERLIPQVVLDSLKEVIGKWEAVELIASRGKAKEEASRLIVERLKLRNIVVSGFDITDISYNTSFEKAVEDKVVAIQRAIEEQNRTVQIREQAKQTVLQAEATAQSIRIRAQALEKNAKLVEWEAVQKWNGVLPQYMLGSATPFINLKP